MHPGIKNAFVQDANVDLGKTATHPKIFSSLSFEFLLKLSVIFQSHEFHPVISETRPIHL